MENEMNPEFAALLEKANAGDIAAMIKVRSAIRNGNKRMAVTTNDITASQMTSTEIVLIGKGKKRIGRKTFANRADLVRVEIASSVQSIGCAAFENCTELESVVIPASVTAIEADAFRGCAKLRQIELPEGVSRIEERSFCDCVKLECVKLPTSLTEIKAGAFKGCILLASAQFPDSLRIIGNNAFSECSSLSAVNFPKELLQLGNYAFSGCESLQEVVLPTVRCISSVFKNCTGLRTVKAGGAVETMSGTFQGCVALSNVTLPQGLQDLGGGVFEGCRELREIEIPNTVKQIGCGCFKGCVGLERFVGGKRILYSHGVFDGCVKLSDVIADGVMIYSAARSGRVVIPNGVTRIVEHAFYNEPNITSVDFPDTLEDIGDWAFYGCTGIKEVVLPMRLKKLGAFAFQKCTSLEMIQLPPTLEEVEGGTFEGCGHLTTVSTTGLEPRAGSCVLPASVKWIGDRAFCGCAFTALVLPQNIEGLGNMAFWECSKLESVEVPKLPSRVYYNVFGECRSLKKIRLAYQCGCKDGDADLGLFSGCTIDDAVIPCYLESKIDKLFGEYVPQTLSLVYEDGSVRPLELAEKRDESDEDRAFFAEYGIHRGDIKYSYEAAYDVYMGCRMQSPAKESRSVVIPEKYKDGDARTLIAKIYKKGSSKTYSVRDRDSDLESYLLQRDAKNSKFWPVFAALAAYKPDAKK